MWRFLRVSFALCLSLFSLSGWGLDDGKAISLNDALDAMMARHPVLLSKQSQVASKGYLLESAKAERFPTASLSYGEALDREQEGAFIVKQPLWAFGRIDAGIEYASTDIAVEKLDQLRLTRELLKETASAYMRVQGIQEQLQIVANNIKQHEAFLEQIERRSVGRLASETDTRLAASRLTQARVESIQMEGELRDAITELKTYTQLPVATVIPVDTMQLLTVHDDEVIRDIVLKQSADVQHKEQLVDLAVKDVQRKRADYMPTLYLKMSHDYSDSATYPDETRFSLMIEGSLEGMGFITRFKEKSAFSQLRAAERDVEVTQFDLENRLNTLLLNRATQVSLVEIHQESIDQLDATLQSYLRQYKSGRKEWLDVLNIQREMTEQKLAQAQARNNIDLSAIELVALMGGLDALLTSPLMP